MARRQPICRDKDHYVRTIYCENGARIDFYNGGYRDASPEEIQRRRDALNDAILWIDRIVREAEEADAALQQ